MTAVGSSSDEDVPIASKCADVEVKKEEVLDEKKQDGVLNEKKSTTSGTGKGKGTGKKVSGVKKAGSGKKPATEKKGGKSAGDGKGEDKKKPRKVYDMPGQTRDTPDEEDPLRRFYTSLLEQIPSSEMAKKWCVIHGLVSIEEAKKWVAKYGKKSAPATAKKRNVSAVGGKPAAKKATKKASTGKPAAKKAKATSVKKATYKEDPSDSDEEVIPKKRLKVVRKSKVPSSSPIAKFKDSLNFSDSDSDVPLAQKVAS